MWEQGPPHALDVETLETAAGWDHLNYLETPACAVSRLRPLLAHTKVWVADDGRERLVGLSVVGSHFTFYEFDERGDRVATVATELPFSNPLTHDFSLTEHTITLWRRTRCGTVWKSKFTVRSSTCTPSMRRLLDGVAVWDTRHTG